MEFMYKAEGLCVCYSNTPLYVNIFVVCKWLLEGLFSIVQIVIVEICYVAQIILQEVRWNDLKNKDKTCSSSPLLEINGSLLLAVTADDMFSVITNNSTMNSLLLVVVIGEKSRWDNLS